MKRKWKDARGETLVEVMASILIGALSVVLLFTAVLSSSKMDETAKDVDKEFNALLKAAEERTGVITIDEHGNISDPSEETATVTVNGKDVTVHLYGGEGVYSYALKVSDPGGGEDP